MTLTLKIQLIMLAAIAISLGLGLLLGSAWTERKYRGPVRRIHALENFKQTAEALCPKLTSGKKTEEEEGDYLPENLPGKTERVKSKTVKGNPSGVKFIVLKHGKPREF